MQAALHPTPAVCGRPRLAAKHILASKEAFDRGFYSGPFGWLSGAAAEFVVAIRSALIHAHDQPPQEGSPVSIIHGRIADNHDIRHSQAAAAASSKGRIISLFAGVGIVKGSTPEAEWQVSKCHFLLTCWYRDTCVQIAGSTFYCSSPSDVSS